MAEHAAGCESEGTVSPATTPGEIVRLPFLRPTAELDWPRPPPEPPPSAILPSLEDVLVTDWLRRSSGRQAAERFSKPLLKSSSEATSTSRQPPSS